MSESSQTEQVKKITAIVSELSCEDCIAVKAYASALHLVAAKDSQNSETSKESEVMICE